MIQVMRALREKKNLILDTCEIFIKEPLLDWVKEARKQSQNSSSSSELSVEIDDQIYEEIKWYPTHKIQVMKDKLLGKNAASIMISELKLSQHGNKPYLDTLKTVLKGTESSERY
jgi:DNA-dependent protein kinase catalytic subunit